MIRQQGVISARVIWRKMMTASSFVMDAICLFIPFVMGPLFPMFVAVSNIFLGFAIAFFSETTMRI